MTLIRHAIALATPPGRRKRQPDLERLRDRAQITHLKVAKLTPFRARDVGPRDMSRGRQVLLPPATPQPDRADQSANPNIVHLSQSGAAR